MRKYGLKQLSSAACYRSARDALSPVFRVPTVMLESKNSNVVRVRSVIDRVGEARTQEPPHVRLDDAPSFGSSYDDCHCFIHRVKELGS